MWIIRRHLRTPRRSAPVPAFVRTMEHSATCDVSAARQSSSQYLTPQNSPHSTHSVSLPIRDRSLKHPAQWSPARRSCTTCTKGAHVRIVSPGSISRLARTCRPLVGCCARYRASLSLKCSSPGTRVSSMRSNVTLSVDGFFANLTPYAIQSGTANGSGCESSYLDGTVISRRDVPSFGSSTTAASTSFFDSTPGSMTRMTNEPSSSYPADTSGVDISGQTRPTARGVRCCVSVVSNMTDDIFGNRYFRDGHSVGSRRGGGRYGVVSAR